jgi:sulfite reductase (ferredoxin)
VRHPYKAAEKFTGDKNNKMKHDHPKFDEDKLITSRLLGVYPQRQSGLYMQRIKIFGGRINWPQWRRIAELADLYCNGFPLHISTRQDIELHNITIENLPAVQRGLTEIGLTIFAACGDAVRNITVCTGCDFHDNNYSLLPLAQLVRFYLEELSVVLNLPRKFKISFSGCKKACAKPWLNDLGFIAQEDGLFTVIGAGSLGPKPALGIELYKDLPARDALPLCIAAIELFNQHGDRENRRRARFRHIREKFGDVAFRTQLNNHFILSKERQAWPDIKPARNQNSDIKPLFRLQLQNGNIDIAQAIELAELADPKGAILRINLEHGIELYGIENFQLPDSFARLAQNPIIVACPGSATCQRGLVDCWKTADSIREAFSGGNLSNVRINISGCPNNCGQSAVADISLVGMLRKENGRQEPYYRVLKGGGNGQNNVQAQECCIVSAGDVPDTIRSICQEGRCHTNCNCSQCPGTIT